MKAWKRDLVNEIVREADGRRIVMLKDVAGRLGVAHIKTEDAMAIMRAAEQELPSYRLVRIMMHGTDSFFQSAALVEDGVEFEDREEVG